MPTLNSFDTRTEIRVDGQAVQIYSLPALEKSGFPGVSRLPYSMKILLENLLRREDDAFVKADDIKALAEWKAGANVEKEISYAVFCLKKKNTKSSMSINNEQATGTAITTRSAMTCLLSTVSY